MQPDSPLPPDTNPRTEPSILEEMAALTGLFNPEIIWQEEEILDDMDEQDAASAAEHAAPTGPATDQP
ncbi:hypothetical protein GCM10023172_41390 [Hymenobacter ginsengisoli]|uniref:Uncharacterized protein n=1 Tax=Hymenobacter ginsengisoli TaxID=1051626 RepID=A0ABP8QUP9_9BACT|nr:MULTISPECIES: hypothetical protein [unclassified Hymenobacter]MBO2032217.1 hypothetical protein [Hymenobacter sp. BT559]